MFQIVPVMELVGMRSREIDRGNQQTPAHGILPSLDPQRPQIIRRRMRSGASRLNSRFLLGLYDRWVSPYAAQQLLRAKSRNGSKADILNCNVEAFIRPCRRAAGMRRRAHSTVTPLALRDRSSAQSRRQRIYGNAPGCGAQAA